MADDPDENSAAQAFDALRLEVALLRRALEGLSAERASAPDYRPTLESVVQRQDRVAEVLRQILSRPAVQLTHQDYAASVERASVDARRADRATIQEARDLITRTAGQLASALQRAREAAAQRDALIWAAVLSMGGTGAAIAMARALLG